MPPSFKNLIEPTTPDFRVDGWKIAFGNFRWFRIVGLLDFLASTSFTNRSGIKNEISRGFTVDGIIDAAAQQGKIIIPKDWYEIHPNPEWLSLSGEQLTNAIEELTREFRLDKACLILLAVESFLAKNRVDTSVFWQSVRIMPAVFYVVGYNSSIYEKHVEGKRELIEELKTRSLQRRESTFAEMANGHPVTYRTAKGVWECLTSKPGIKGLDGIEIIRTRRGIKKKPAPSERLVVRA